MCVTSVVDYAALESVSATEQLGDVSALDVSMLICIEVHSDLR